MNYGMYLSAAGALLNLHRQDVFANNLANVETPGFKPDMVFTEARLPERLTSGIPADPQLLLEKLGGGAFARPTYINTLQGGLEGTGNPLDIGLHGPGFLLVASGDPNDTSAHRLTRDGRMTINEGGQLVTSTDGLPVLDRNQRPIRLDPQMPVAIDRTGRIEQDGRAVAQLAIVEPIDASALYKVGGNLLALKGDPNALRPAEARVDQGFVESSAADPIATLNSMIGATKAAQANAKMMQFHDFLMGQAIGTFGRVA